MEPDALVTPLFFLAILLSAWVGGIGPGLLAAVLAMLAIDYFFLEPRYSLRLDLAELPHLVVFLVSAVLVSSWSVARRRAEKLLRQARDEQEAKVQERTAASNRPTRSCRRRSRNAAGRETWRACPPARPPHDTVSRATGRRYHLLEPRRGICTLDER